jgi:hypothetical protein
VATNLSNEFDASTLEIEIVKDDAATGISGEHTFRFKSAS